MRSATTPERWGAAMERWDFCRSLLFVPADRPDRYGKALASGADAVCIDLEDAVAAERKAAGRAALEGFLGRRGAVTAPLVVRINEAGSEEGRLDAEALAGLSGAAAPFLVAAVMLPKVRDADAVREAVRLSGNAAARVLPMVETARGLENAVEIGGADPKVAGLVFGGFDLCLELGAEPCWESLLYARSRVVHAAAASGVAAFDMPSRDVRGDLADLREETVRARRLGFSGKAVVHPAQVPVVHDVFGAGEQEAARAQRIVEAAQRSRGAPVLVDGKMVDGPIVESAKRTLDRNALRRRAT